MGLKKIRLNNSYIKLAPCVLWVSALCPGLAKDPVYHMNPRAIGWDDERWHVICAMGSHLVGKDNGLGLVVKLSKTFHLIFLGGGGGG